MIVVTYDPPHPNKFHPEDGRKQMTFVLPFVYYFFLMKVKGELNGIFGSYI